MNAFMNVIHANTCNCTACTTVPTLGIKMPYEAVKDNCLAVACPKAATMLSRKSTFSAYEVTVGSHRKAIFVCEKCKQEFEAIIKNVVDAILKKGTSGCPVCKGRTVVPSYNDLATTCPEAAAMLSCKNPFSANEVTSGSHRKAIFVCKDCHQEFSATIENVTIAITTTHTTGCPICRGRKVARGYNDLATVCPQAAAMWSYKNKLPANLIHSGCNNIGIFVCSKCQCEFEKKIDEVVKSITKSRGKYTGCPICAGRKVVVGQNDLATYLKKQGRENILAFIRQDSKYQAEDVSYGSRCRLSLNCPECGMRWEITANNLARGARVCSKCNYTKNCISMPEQYVVRIALAFANGNGIPNAFDEVRPILGKDNKYGVDFVDNIRKIGMEYNGSYFHKKRAKADKFKFLKFRNAGYIFIRILEPGLEVLDQKYDIVLPKKYKKNHTEYKTEVMEEIGYKLVSLLEEVYNRKATPEILALVNFNEFKKWYVLNFINVTSVAYENAVCN